MGSPIGEAGESFQQIARHIQEFMWEGKPHKSIKKEHTTEEYEEFLEGVREWLWSEYNDIANYLGWRD